MMMMMMMMMIMMMMMMISPAAEVIRLSSGTYTNLCMIDYRVHQVSLGGR